MEVGDETKLSVPPESAYGLRDPEAVQIVPKSSFDNAETIEVGMVVQGEGQQGRPFHATVTEISPENVTLDFNHPLAGKTLDFELRVVEVS
jgi:FKBP-type peptidyl-prolyl cis-trans isomerase SlyD